MKMSISMLAVGSVFAIMTSNAFAAKDRTGAEVVKAVCMNCHETGTDGAPKIGDLAAWGPRMSQGIKTLATHAVQGYRGMPAHGGEINATDIELSRAIIYMIAPKSVASDGMNASMVIPKYTGKELYAKRCQECHADGKDGAPKTGDPKAWGGRMTKGMDGLTASAVSGHEKMPSRGGLATISDAEIRLAITYMISSASTSFAKQQVAKPQR
jgi:cytochrome c5